MAGCGAQNVKGGGEQSWLFVEGGSRLGHLQPLACLYQWNNDHFTPLLRRVMPVYTVFHLSFVPPDKKDDLAIGLTDLHCHVTEASRESVKVMFIELDRDSFFSGGEKTEDYARAVAQIRSGRTDEQKTSILRGMYEILRAAVELGDIQTQIVEIEDTKTVMTNGVLNI